MTLSSTSTTSSPPLRPFLKWAGGKGRLLSRILPYVPDHIVNYYEPFLGGGAVYFAVHDRLEGTAYLADLNEHLINVWRVVQQAPDALLQELESYKRLDSKEFYYEQRRAEPATPIRRAAWFIYLNQTAWNGLWRVNRFGEFNVPWGERAFRGIDRASLYAISKALSNAFIAAEDFRNSLLRPTTGDFVYLDPPYLPLSDTSKFHLYTQQGFRARDLVELAQICHDLTDRQVYWIMSNRDTPQVRDLFSRYQIVRFTTRRSVAAQNRRHVENADSPEALILGCIPQ